MESKEGAIKLGRANAADSLRNVFFIISSFLMETARCISRVHLADCFVDRVIYDVRAPRFRNLYIPAELRFYRETGGGCFADSWTGLEHSNVLIEFNPAVIFEFQ